MWHDDAMAMHQPHSRAMAIALCHTIITCKQHGGNLIGTTEFRNKPQKALKILSLLEGGAWERD